MNIPPAAPIVQAEGQTDVMNARRLAKLHQSRMRYWRDRKKWLVFDGKRWHLNDLAAVRFSQQLSDSLWREAQEAGTNDARKFAVKSANSSGVKATLAMAEPLLEINGDELNVDPWLFNFQNGTMDLRTGELREHDPLDFITQICPHQYDPHAPCTLWRHFFATIFAQDTELIAFMQRLLGYAMTGVIHEHILPIFHGTGSNGKSVLNTALLHAFGDDYADSLPENFMMESKERHLTELTILHGKRFCTAQETNEGDTLNEARIKQLTGGDTITARGLFEDHWSFKPTHLMALSANHKPRVKGTDHGIWRRMMLVPFSVTIPDDEQDPELATKLMQESPGILRWMVEGCQMWQAQGLNPPAKVMAATREYRESEDVLQRFITECCLSYHDHPHLKANLKVKASLFQEELEKWCQENSCDAPKKLKDQLEKIGYERSKRTAQGYFYLGLAIQAESSMEGSSSTQTDEQSSFDAVYF